MKKLLTISAVALCAVASQAAAIKWTSGGLYKPANADGGWSTTKAGTTVSAYYFLIDNNLAEAYSGTYAKGASETDAAYAERLYNAYKDGTLDSAAIQKSGEVKSSGSMTSKADWTTPVDTTNEKYAYAVAIFTTTVDGKDFFMATGASAQINSMGDQSNGTGLAQAVGSWSVVPTSAPDPGPIPEPTTVALLALGLVAAGLKRKVA